MCVLPYLCLCRALLLTSGGVPGLGGQETPGQRWSGGGLEAVTSLVVRQWSSGHSVMRGLFAHAQTWNTASGSCLWLFARAQSGLMDLNVDMLQVPLRPRPRPRPRAPAEPNHPSAWLNQYPTTVYTRTQSQVLRTSCSSQRPRSIMTRRLLVCG